MPNIKNFNIVRTYCSNINEDFTIEVLDGYGNDYNFDMSIGLTIDDSIYVDIKKFENFSTLYKLIKSVLSILNIDTDYENIRYKFSDTNYISFKESFNIMKIYTCGHVLADVYIKDGYIILYKFNSKTLKYEETDYICIVDNNDIKIIRANNISDANMLLSSMKQEILTAVNYYNFLFKR